MGVGSASGLGDLRAFLGIKGTGEAVIAALIKRIARGISDADARDGRRLAHHAGRQRDPFRALLAQGFLRLFDDRIGLVGEPLLRAAMDLLPLQVNQQEGEQTDGQDLK